VYLRSILVTGKSEEKNGFEKEPGGGKMNNSSPLAQGENVHRIREAMKKETKTSKNKNG